MAKLVIFGAGDIARLAQFYFSTDSEHEVVGFAVDPEYFKTDAFQGLPLISASSLPERFPPNEYQLFVALSYQERNHTRCNKIMALKQLGYRFASYVSSRCTFLTSSTVGENCFILEDNTIQPFVSIGNDVFIWSGNHIGHDSEICDHNFISSHVVISGHCKINSFCFLGVNATLHNGVTIAPENIIGAGAVVRKNTEPFQVIVPPASRTLDDRSDKIKL